MSGPRTPRDEDAEPAGSVSAEPGLSDAWGAPHPAKGEGADPLAVHESARYERGLELGRGGMGRVVAARDRRLDRQVALKEVRPGVNQAAAAAQLAAEAQLAAGLDHPGIVAIHDAGRDARGQPWYAMRLVRGQTLTQAARALPSLAERLRLMQPLLAVCHAVAHAHERQIVHRDLKPDNLLVGPHGETQVADWGLACTLARAEAGGVVGTAGFMAPEVAAGRPASPRSDVYSLGTTLVAVLEGGDPGPDRAAAIRSLPPELRAIAERCLQPDPMLRYPDAAALAEDLSAWLMGRRVAAHSYTAVELLVRLVRAFRIPLMVAAGALIVVAAVAWQGYRRTVDQRDRAVSAERAARTSQSHAEEANRAAQKNLAAAYVQAAEAASVSGARPEAETLSAAAVALSPSPVARGILARVGDGLEVALLSELPLPPCRDLVFSPDAQWLLCIRDAEVLLLSGADGRPRWRRTGTFTGGVVSSRAGRILLSDRNHYGTLVDLLTGATLHDGFLLHGWRTNVAQRDSAWAVSYNFGGLELIDLATSRSHPFEDICPHADPLIGVAFTARPGTLVAACLSGRSFRISIERGIEPIAPAKPASQRTNASAIAVAADDSILGGGMDGSLWHGGREIVSWSGGAGAKQPSAQSLIAGPDGAMAALAEGLGPVVWRRLDEAPIHLPVRDSRALAFVDADTVAVVGERLRRWRLRRPPHPAILRAGAGIAHAAISPDARWIAAGAGDGFLTIWRGDSGEVAARLRVGTGVVKSVAFSPDGEHLAIGLADAPGFLLLGVGSWQHVPAPHPVYMKRLGYFKNGLIWRNPYLQGPDVIDGHGARTAVGSSPSLCRAGEAAVNTTQTGLVYSCLTGELALVRQEEPARAEFLPGALWVTAVALSADRRTVAIAEESRIRLLDVASRSWQREIADPGRRIINLAFSPDDRLLLASELDGTIRIWTLSDGAEVAVLRAHSQRVAHLCFGPASVGLLSASWDGTIRRWDLDRVLAPPQTLPGEVAGRWGLRIEEALAAPLR